MGTDLRPWIASAMPSRLHEDLLRLFQNRPSLAAELAREALHVQLPDYEEARVESANLSDLRPAEYRADLMGQGPVHGIVVEVQLAQDDDKKYVWPAYVCNLRNRIRSPVCLFVVTVDADVARWATQWVKLGGENLFRPWVLGPSDVPEITEETTARNHPELAVLSAVAHGSDPDTAKVVRIAVAAGAALLDIDVERSTLYSDMLFEALSEAARQALRHMNLPKYEYQTEFAKRYYGQGLSEGLSEGLSKGRIEGRAELVLQQLTRRFGDLPESAGAAVRGASLEELDRIGERLLTAGSLAEALGSG